MMKPRKPRINRRRPAPIAPPPELSPQELARLAQIEAEQALHLAEEATAATSREVPGWPNPMALVDAAQRAAEKAVKEAELLTMSQITRAEQEAERAVSATDAIIMATDQAIAKSIDDAQRVADAAVRATE